MIRVLGAPWCPDCRRAKAFLAQHRVEFEWTDIDDNEAAVAEVERYNGGKRIIPTVIFDDGSFLAEPANEELADKLGLMRTAGERSYDLVIAGGGPTSLTAAIYAARENISTLVVERSSLGGQAGVTERLDNYPGFPEGVGGAELAARFVQQAERYGVELLQAVSLASFEERADGLVVRTATDQLLDAGALLVATGSSYRRTGAEGEEDLIGAGIHFCATCDGPFYRGVDEVVVIGGGNSGLEEGLFLTQFADHVSVIERSGELRGSRHLQDKVREHPKMSVYTGQAVTRFVDDGSGHLRSVLLEDLASGEEREHMAKGAFVFIGLDPTTEWLGGALALDERGFIVTDEMFRTSAPGVFAAGDVRAGSTKQLASAVGEGAAVAIQIRYHLDRLGAMAG